MNTAKKAGERMLLRPTAGMQWEVWAMDGNHARLVKTCDTPAGAALSSQSLLALPLRQLFAVPLWLATGDPTLMRGMIFLQLERRGLAAGRSPQELVFDYRVVTTLDNKTLVLAIALPPTFPVDLCLDIRACEPSARVHPLPSDEFILWRESGRLVLAVTREQELAFIHALGDEAITSSVLQELQCIKLQLDAENVSAQIRGITLWGEFTPAEISGIAEAMEMRVANVPRPAPVLPSGEMDLVPAAVRQTQRMAKINGRRMSLAKTAAAIYAALLLVLVLHVSWLCIDCKRLESGLDSHKTEVGEIEATSRQWDALDSAINPESYPVELLLRSYRVLPRDGVRFTLFETNPGKILIQGEAGNAAAAFKFADDLQHSGDFQDYKWEMAKPPMLPNGNAKFQIEGVKYGAKID